MKRYITILLLTLLSVVAWGQEDFNPPSPSEPNRYFSLTVHAEPQEGGAVSPAGKNSYTEGTVVRLTASPHSNYRFIEWRQGGSPITQSPTFNYTIPATDSELTAHYLFAPSSPDEPTVVPLRHNLSLTATPREGGHFNVTSGTSFYEGEEVRLQAYPNSNYQFIGWSLSGSIVSTSPTYTIEIADDCSLEALFQFNPSSPPPPFANDWNRSRGELLVDDFTAGELSTAIDQAIGGYQNRDEVQSLRVIGSITGGDFGIMRSLENCAALDLGRISGATEIPSYAFSGSNLNTVILPSTITSIGSYAFRECNTLAEIICYNENPPTLGYDVFQHSLSTVVLRVPTTSIELYTQAAQWNQLMILPFAETIGALRVTLPAIAASGAYKNMTIELQNTTTGQKLNYLVTDKMSYYFGGLPKGSTYHISLKDRSGIVLGSIERVTVADEHTACEFSSLSPLKELSVTICDKQGVPQQAAVKWFDAANNYLQQSSTLERQSIGATLYYEVVLGETEGRKYIAPKREAYQVVDGSNRIVVVLSPIPSKEINGVVVDDTQQVVPNAAITISQLLNGKYPQSTVVQSDKDGLFRAEVSSSPTTTLTASKSGYMGCQVTLSGEELDTIPSLVMTPIHGVTITNNLSYTPSVMKDSLPQTLSGYSDYTNLDYTLFNVTQNHKIADFWVDYPTLVFNEGADIGDEIRITTQSRKDAFPLATTTTRVEEGYKATATTHLIAWGSLVAQFKMNYAPENVALLYSADGVLIESYTYANYRIATADLPDGNYTLISMASSRYFNSILNLAEFEQLGLQEGVDYIRNDVEVGRGVVTTVDVADIPALDESKLYYTSDATLFSVNKSAVTAGNFVTLRTSLDFKEEFRPLISNVKLFVDLPATCEFVENSILSGNSLVQGYTLTADNQLEIPLTDYTQLVRFCTIPTQGGEQAPNAFVEFTLNGEPIRQPIGAALFEAKDLTITLPENSSRERITVRGTAQGGATISIFDTDVLIGQTTALANGNWSAAVELYNPRALSKHTIHAEVLTKLGMKLTSERKSLFHNSAAVEASKVTLINGGTTIVFDLFEGTHSQQSYSFVPSRNEFTFKVEFTPSDSSLVDGVKLNVFTSNNKVDVLEPQFDPNSQAWLATARYNSSALPVNVSVDFIDKTQPLLDTSELDEITSEFDGIAQAHASSMQAIDDLSLQIDSILADNSQDITEMEQAIDSLLVGNGLSSLYEEGDATLEDSIMNMSDEEFEAFVVQFEKEFDETLAEAQEVTKSYENYFSNPKEYEEYFEKDGLTGTIKRTTAKGYNNDNLIADGFEANPTADGGVLYTKTTDNESLMVDLSKDVYQSVVLDDSSIEQLQQEAEGEGSSWTDKMYKIGLEVKDYGFSFIDEVNNLIDDNVGQIDKLVFKRNLAKAIHKRNTNPVLKKTSLKMALDSEVELVKLKRINDSFNQFKIRPALQKTFNVVSTIASAVEIHNTYNSLFDLLPEECPTDKKNYDLVRAGVVSYWAAFQGINIYLATSSSRRISIMSTGLASALPSGGTSLPATVALLAADAAASYGLSMLRSWGEKQIINNLEDRINNLNCTPDEESPGNPLTPSIAPIIDPSGYVYEAVPSNRLAGVTTTVYHKVVEEDMYGDKHEKIVAWDAEAYEQENPLITDEEGMYAWDVPQGMWQVKYEKEGYQTAYSQWLPVPPPQLEVNIGLVQHAQPTVKSVKGYSKGIEVTFDKYMIPSTLTVEQVVVSRNGAEQEGIIEAIDIEEDSYSNKHYLSSLRFVPTAPFLLTDSVVITIKRQAKSYSSVMMEHDFTQQLSIELEATHISLSDSIEIPTNKITYTEVAVTPCEASRGKILRLHSSSLAIVTVPDSVVLDQEGKASIPLTAQLPGVSLIEIEVEGGSLKDTIAVTTYMPKVYAQGDSNEDGVVDQLDMENIAQYIAGEEIEVFNTKTSDAFADELINVSDIAHIAHIITNDSVATAPSEGFLLGTENGIVTLESDTPVRAFSFAYTGTLEPTVAMDGFTIKRYTQEGEKRLLAYTLTHAVVSGALFTTSSSIQLSDHLFVDAAGYPLLFEGTTAAIPNISTHHPMVYGGDNRIIFTEDAIGERYVIYNISGSIVAASTVTSVNLTTKLGSGIYLIHLGGRAYKVIVK